MIELKIKKKYFDAILELKKPFELRHKPIEKGTKVKLVEISDNMNDVRYLDIASGLRHEMWVKFKNEDIEKSKKLNVSLDIIAKIREADGQNEYADFLRTNIHQTGRYIIFESGECRKLENLGNEYYGEHQIFGKPNEHDTWYDNFCWDYINEKQTYLIKIAKIIEVK